MIELTLSTGAKALIAPDTIRFIEPTPIMVQTSVVPDCKKSFPEAEAGIHDGSLVFFKLKHEALAVLETVAELKELLA